MDLVSSVAFTQGELSFIRQCIDLSTISSKDAKFVANIQIKIEAEIQQMIEMQQQEEAEKLRQLEEIKSTRKK